MVSSRYPFRPFKTLLKVALLGTVSCDWRRTSLIMVIGEYTVFCLKSALSLKSALHILRPVIMYKEWKAMSWCPGRFFTAACGTTDCRKHRRTERASYREVRTLLILESLNGSASLVKIDNGKRDFFFISPWSMSLDNISSFDRWVFRLQRLQIIGDSNLTQLTAGKNHLNIHNFYW